MTSSKKKRGKQRKAAKNLAAANNISDATTPAVGRVPSIPAGYTAMQVSPSQIVALVQKGNKSATIALLSNEISDIPFEINGVLPSVLRLLQKCEHETFATLMAGIGGDLPSPSLWISLILKATMSKPSCCMQIAQNIGPMVRCMCNDTKRLFFKSNKHWKEAITYFVVLIWILVRTINSEESNDTKLNIVGTLLKHEGLLRTIVQWGFWGEEHRPDIAKELDVNRCSRIVQLGKEITSWIICDVYDDRKEYQEIFGINPLEIIATTPIVSKDYDPNCMISYMAGLIRLVRATNGDKNL